MKKGAVHGIGLLSVGVVAVLCLASEGLAQDYVTSKACKFCHRSKHRLWRESGHAFKLNKVKKDQAPEYPFSDVPNPPDGIAWSDVSYVIGGYGWKARFMDSIGQIIIGEDVQWNLETEGWVDYHNDAAHGGPWNGPDGRQDYTCGKCHTTGYDEAAEPPLPGIVGNWAEASIGCEACHGPGGYHVPAPSPATIDGNPDSTVCGQCHTRDAQNRIEVSGGLIRHHEQYDEFLHSPHAGELECATCHDPHKTAKYGAEGAIRRRCQDCHDQTVQVSVMQGLDCVDCHMPFAVKSAVSHGKKVWLRGDIRSHIWEIKPTKKKASRKMFYEEDGKTFAKGFLTLDFACLTCHDGTQAKKLKLSQGLARFAKLIHPKK